MYNYVNNKVSSLSYMDGSVTTDIVTNITYEAFNPRLSSYTWGLKQRLKIPLKSIQIDNLKGM